MILTIGRPPSLEPLKAISESFLGLLFYHIQYTTSYLLLLPVVLMFFFFFLDMTQFLKSFLIYGSQDFKGKWQLVSLELCILLK